MLNKIILYNEFHLGDNIFTCIYFYNISDYKAILCKVICQ